MEVNFVGLSNAIVILSIHLIIVIVHFIENDPHLPTVKKYVVRKLEAILSCAHCVTRNVATGSSTQRATRHG